MLQSLIFILDESAPSFCYYENKSALSSKIITEDTLKKAITFCLKNNLQPTILYGNRSLPRSFYKLLDTISHIKIVPFEYRRIDENSIIVSTKNDLVDIERNKSKLNNLIFKMNKEDLSNLSNYFNKLLGHFTRLNIVFSNLELFNSRDYEILKEQLAIIEPILIIALSKSTFEINFITDRWLLSEMNNCGAGIKHITVAPNGKLYICPAFYFEDEQNFIGEVESGYNIKNEQILDFEHAPICRNCDSFHCKRCVFLNQKTTLELNTPSSQQCIVSHIERNFSKQILDKLQTLNKFSNLIPISEIDYLDPFELIINNKNNYTINAQKWNKTKMLQKNS